MVVFTKARKLFSIMEEVVKSMGVRRFGTIFGFDNHKLDFLSVSGLAYIALRGHVHGFDLRLSEFSYDSCRDSH